MSDFISELKELWVEAQMEEAQQQTWGEVSEEERQRIDEAFDLLFRDHNREVIDSVFGNVVSALNRASESFVIPSKVETGTMRHFVAGVRAGLGIASETVKAWAGMFEDGESDASEG